MNTPVIETAYALYREMSRKGLHFRKENGRDNELLESLASRLRCSSSGFSSSLKRSKLSAEEFLIHFLEIAEPFSKMYEEIWGFLNKHKAPDATEIISVRFGFPRNKNKTTVNLEAFRRQVDSIKKIDTRILQKVWPERAFSALFKIKEILLETDTLEDQVFDISYHRGDHLQLPFIAGMDHSFDSVVYGIKTVFQQVIDTAERSKDDNSDQAYILSNLLPSWHGIFQGLSRFSDVRKDKALDHYNKHIQPLLIEHKATVDKLVREFLDILDLPFWQHRWHMYEVWCTIRSLKALRLFEPKLRITNGRFPIDGYDSGIIADLTKGKFPEACITVQHHTAYITSRRKGIKPDLKVLFDQEVFNPESTAMVIEYKQHKTLNKPYIEEIMDSYTKGFTKSEGLIVVNYDALSSHPTCPPKAVLLHGFQPNNPKVLQLFEGQVNEIMNAAGFGISKIILFDVSSSMKGTYIPIWELLSDFNDRNDIEIHHFNTHLKENETGEHFLPVTNGGTDIETSLKELHELKGHLKEIVIVTDEPFRKHLRPFIDNIHTCIPADLPSLLAKLKW